jgi:hypothetical protein
MHVSDQEEVRCVAAAFFLLVEIGIHVYREMRDQWDHGTRGGGWQFKSLHKGPPFQVRILWFESTHFVITFTVLIIIY